MKQSLYQVTAEYLEASEKLHDSELDEQTVLDTLEGMSGAVEAKATNVGFVIRNLDGLAAQIKQAEDDMAKRRKSIENHAARLRAYLLANMQTANIQKIESPYFVLSIRNNPESVVIDADSQIPDEFIREVPATYVADKVAIKKAIQDGQEVPGCHLTRTQSLSIK
jgi:hypothetical protein